MLILAFLRIFFNQPEIVEDTTSLCGLTKLSNTPPHQLSVLEIYSSNVLTTQTLGSYLYA